MLTRILLTIVVAGLPLMAFSQARSIELYPYNYTSISPAFAGVDGTKFTFIGNLVTWGGDYYPYTGFLGAETSYKNVGFGLTAFRQRASALTRTEIALPVNYQWKINEKNKLVFATRLSYQHAVVDFDAFIPLDPNDPLLTNDNKMSQSRPNVSLGTLYKGDLLYAGFSVDNILTKEDPSVYAYQARKYNLIIGKDLKGKGKWSSMHSIYAAMNDNFWTLDVNNSVIFKDLIIAGFSIEFNDDTQDQVIPKVNAGVKFGDYGKAVIMLYSASNDERDLKFRGQLFLMFTLPSL